jgi:hypothetical protein
VERPAVTATMGVDPGKRTGLGIVGPGLVGATILVEPTEAQILKLLKPVRRYVTRLAIEGQHVQTYPGKDQEVQAVLNWPSLLSLVQSRMRWEVIGRLLGFDVVIVLRQTWQGPMLPKAESPTETTKQRAKRAVVATWDDVPKIESFDPPKGKPRASTKVPYDSCDALLIARWASLYGGRA